MAATPSAALQGLSGALSGVLSLALMYPLDNIRTRMQVRRAACAARAGPSRAAGPLRELALVHSSLNASPCTCPR